MNLNSELVNYSYAFHIDPMTTTSNTLPLATTTEMIDESLQELQQQQQQQQAQQLPTHESTMSNLIEA